VICSCARAKIGFAGNVYRVTNDEEVLSFLRKASPYQHAGTPQLVVPDLNVPKRDRWYVLAERRSDAVLRDLSFVVMSRAPASRNEAVEGDSPRTTPYGVFDLNLATQRK
jgi:hypothetical protein